MSSARAYRLAPRRRPSGRATRVDWDRLGRLALVLIFCLVLFSYVGPLLRFVDSYRDAKAESSQLVELKSENANLRTEALTLTKPDAAERGARRVGMVAAGERPYVIRGKHGR